MKILIVEDDPLISRMYQKAFGFEGYEVEMAADGEDGLAKAQSAQPNIILLDIMMPKLNGVQVLTQLKQTPTTQNIPVIMLTNLADNQDVEAAMQQGAVKYIVKSDQDPNQVVAMVKEVLGH